MLRFSPLAGIRLVESHLEVSYWVLLVLFSFSPLAGIRLVESAVLPTGGNFSAKLLFQSPCGD